MLYIVGLGLDEKSLSLEAKEAINKSELYLEGYTVDFPYSIQDLEQVLGKKIYVLKREQVENFSFMEQSKKSNVALLVYGSPFFATTHISILEEAKKQGIDVKIFFNASVFDALGETGLQLYKFGKITSIPSFKPNFRPTGFLDIVKHNQTIKAHSLVLVDIGLEFNDALKQLQDSASQHDFKLGKIVVCSRLGTKDKKIVYDDIENLKVLDIQKPYCFVFPSDLHFVEREFLERVNFQLTSKI